MSMMNARVHAAAAVLEAVYWLHKHRISSSIEIIFANILNIVFGSQLSFFVCARSAIKQHSAFAGLGFSFDRID